MRQRYYNTEIKRFINQDIVVGSIDNGQSLNRYSYVQGNPVTLTDPFGLSPSAKDIVMGAIHGLLDVVGCSPEGIGIAANLLNAALYAFVDHDYGMASLSLLAGVTLGATKVVAMGGKLAKAAKTVETAGKFVSNVASFAICTTQAVNVGSEMWQKYYVEGRSLDGSSAMEFLTLGLNMAGMAMSGKGMVESGNKICKSIKESGVTNKVSGKVKYWAKRAWNSNGGFVDPSAPVVIGGSKSGSGTRIFTSKDPLVGDVATQIEQRLPGRIISVNKVVYRPDRTILTDLDIELDNIVIQVKTGGGKGLTKQLIKSANSTGKIAIGYVPDIKPSVLKEANKNGFQVFKNIDDLTEFISQH